MTPDYDIQFIIIDLFCGAGGVTTGMEKARVLGKKAAKVIACINHDPMAIASHKANHDDCHHFTEDIRTASMEALKKIVAEARQRYPNALLILWASLECTNFSNAKGGKPRDADSRTLAEHLYRYIDALRPDYVQIENVREFMSWGPLDKKGKPIHRTKGRDYEKWVQHIKGYGYSYDFRMLNAADYGAYTSRVRYFGCFALEGLPIVFPAPTHARKPKHRLVQKWKPVREVLDLEDTGQSIFNREVPLVEATLARIYAGLLKFVGNGEETFLSRYYSGSDDNRNHSTEEPAGTLTTENRIAIVNALRGDQGFLTKYFSGRPEGKVLPLDVPAGTLTTACNQSVVFIAKYYGNGDNVQSTDVPAGTITTKDRMNVVNAQFMDTQYGQGKGQSIDQPAGTVTSVPKLNLVSLKPFLSNFQFSNPCHTIHEPAPTLMASRRHYYLINPQWGGNLAGIDKPGFTLIARMDKAPPYLVVTEGGELAIAIHEGDSEMMRKIKLFMVHYGIVDITMRMLKVPELLRIQGFPTGYRLEGTLTDQKKFIGNAVVPIVPQRWVETLAKTIKELMYEHV